MGPPGSLLLVRHGRSTYNATHRLNGDPAVRVDIDRTGIGQMTALRERVGSLPVDLGVHTSLGRTRQSLDILLEGRDVPRVECADLDDVRLGRFEGAEVGAYREWREGRGQDARPDGGESRVDALARYARGFERLAAARADLPLVVTHDIPIRFLANAMRGEDPLEGPVTAVDNGSLLVVPRAELLAAIGVMKMTLTRTAT